jgi:hypothetical protein
MITRKDLVETALEESLGRLVTLNEEYEKYERR